MAEQSRRHRWVCADVSQRAKEHNTICPLADLVHAAINAPGVYLLYTFSEHILAGRFGEGHAANDLVALLRSATGLHDLEPERVNDDGLPDLSSDAARTLLLCPDNPESKTTSAVFAGLLKRVERQQGQPVFVLVSTGIYDALELSPIESRLRPDPSVHEILLWDVGDLPSGSLADHDAWCGAGWIGPRCRDLASAHGELFPAQHLADTFHRGLDNLVRLTRDPTRPQTDPRGRKDAYLSALSRFLPPLSGPGDLLIPSAVGSWGGPRPWQRIETGIFTLERHLLLDGWLSLWVDEAGGWWYQPSSLVLLAWVAWELNLRHCESPAAFLGNYAWGESPHWFGGRWRS